MTPSGAPSTAELPAATLPAFSLALPFGGHLTTADLRGRPAVLLLVPGAFTPVCTSELREHAAAFSAGAAARLVVISCDAPAVLAAWRQEQQVDWVEVASDFWPHGAACRALGAFDERRGTALRRTLLVDDGGAIRWQTTSPGGVARRVESVLAAVAQLAAPAAPAPAPGPTPSVG